MPTVRFQDNLTMVTQTGTMVTVRTDPYPLGAHNHADVRANVEVLDSVGGTPTAAVMCEASDDGQNYAPYGHLDLQAIGATGIHSIDASAPFAFIRFAIQLNHTGGTAGDMSWMTLDLHVNFTHT